jgi:hypothetical protein
MPMKRVLLVLLRPQPEIVDHVVPALLQVPELQRPAAHLISGHGHRETIGQHRIRWARTAGVSAVPVWFDASTVCPPRDAVLLQRG